MSIHGRLIDVVKDGDLAKLASANSREHVNHVIATLIARLPVPRAYLVEMEVDPTSSLGTLWEEGRDVLSSDLVQRCVSVVDPETLRYLATWSTHVADRVAIYNPFLTEFLPRPGLFQKIYTPDHEDFSDLRATAYKEGVRTHLWQPGIEVRLVKK